MQRMNKFRDFVFIFVIIGILVSAFLVLSPYYIPVPHRDSGIFLYIGSEILHGKVLYQQTWDNKQPLLYLLNAAGLLIGGGSAWGVWGLELVLFIIALILMYYILRKSLPSFASFSVSIATFLTIFQIMSGNFSEEYAIFFQVCILAVLFLIYLPNKHRFSRPISASGIGILIGLVFCIKQTYLDVAISSVLLIVFLGWIEKDRKIITNLLWIIFGFVLVNTITFLYFYVHGALNDYIISAFLINKYYSSQGLLEWIHSVLEIFEFNSTYPFLFIMNYLWLGSVFILLIKSWPFVKQFSQRSFLKWITLLIGLSCLGLFAFAEVKGKSSGIGLLQWSVLTFGILFLTATLKLFTNKPLVVNGESWKYVTIRQKISEFEWKYPNTATFLFLGIIDEPIVVVAISLSGMNFNHYYISFFSPLFLLLSASVFFLSNFIRHNSQKLIFTCVLVSILLSGSIFPLLQIIARLQGSGTQDSRSETAAYLKSVTSPQEKILVWGWESGIYFLANRESPTRYSFQFPAYFDSPYKQEVLTTLLNDIKTNPPQYIADTDDPEMPFIQGKTTAECLKTNPIDGDNLHAILNYVCSHYEFVKSFATINIYKRDS